MMRLSVGGPALAVALVLATAAGAVAPSPYDITYTLRADGAAPLYADMSEKAAKVGSLPAGASGIVLRWCRKEIPFGAWQFGSRKEQLKLLDERWCEVSYEGKVGNVPGRVLSPE
ncbi:hypothetical protein [Chthonobacter albigriseus]|uniref:hypothetical protein n=1 Tax=Chthonobacter albigriseus TaxID=1683161 RepID=UPI0015EF5F08|nr:hypothetical protein [Chthonobacter albigriseus]